MQASSANPVDNAIAAGMLAGMFEHEFPVTLGRDYAGVVEQVGADVTRFAPGDEVYGFVPQLLDAGTLKIHIQDSYELDRAPEALQALGSTHTRGKLAIRVA